MRPLLATLVVLGSLACAHGRGTKAPPEPEILAPGVLSIGNVFRGSFTPDQREFYFFKHVGEDANAETYRIFRSVRTGDGVWSEPEVVTLGDPASDLYPVIRPDGRRMVFSSYRPAPGDTTAHPSAYLWRVDREGERWGEPVFLGSVTDYAHYHAQPAFDARGRLKFNRQTWDYDERAEWIAAPNGDGYFAPEPSKDLSYWRSALPDHVFLWETIPGRDDSTILLVVSERDAETRRPGPADLWAARRTADGWTDARPLAGGVNTPDKTENFAFFNPAGDTLYFVRDFAEFRRVSLAAALGPSLQAVADPSMARPLTQVIDAYPDASPDGSRIVFQSNRTGRWELFTIATDGTGMVQLTNAPGDNVTPSWSPDGRKIAFAASHDGNSEILVMNADGTEMQRLTDHPGDDSHPHWSADGIRIVFNSARTTPDSTAEWSQQWHEVVSVSADGIDLVQHTRCRTVCTFPSFSPDGRKIAYRKVIDGPGLQWDLSSGSRNSEIFVSNVDGTEEVNVSRNPAFDGWPRWSPDGRWLAFASNRDGPASTGQIYVVAPNGSKLRRVTTGPWSHVQPAWNQRGDGLYVYRLQEGEGFEFGHVATVPLSID